MKKLWIALMAITALFCLTFAACGEKDKGGDSEPEPVVTKYTVSIAVNNADYGTVSQSNVANVAKDTAITVSGNKITVGTTEITATPMEDDEEYIYSFEGFTGATAKVQSDLTITANFTREDKVVDITDLCEDGVLGYVEKLSTATNQEIVLSDFVAEMVNSVENFKVGETDIPTTYDDTTKTITVATADFTDMIRGEVVCSFDCGRKTFTTRLYVADYVLRTADDITNKYKPVGNVYFVFASDIEGGTISYEQGNFEGVIDGKGHVLKDAVITGGFGFINENVGGPADCVIKNIALVNLTGSDRDMLAYGASAAKVENVYVSGTCSWSDLFECVYDGGLTVNNLIMNFHKLSTGTVHGINDGGSGTVNQDNVINIHAMGEAEFFTTYAEGLGDEWDETPFSVDADGLYFFGQLILENNA